MHSMYDPERHARKTKRIPGFDYSQPCIYMVTICTAERMRLFGTIVDGAMILNEAGKAADACWREIPAHYPQVNLHVHVVMPDHVHGLVEFAGDANHGQVTELEAEIFPLATNQRSHAYQKTLPRSLAGMVRGFKTGVTKWFRENTEIHQPWQKNYYESIIRSEDHFYKAANYILRNPENWLG